MITVKKPAIKKKTFVTLFSASLLFTSCTKDRVDGVTYNGPVQQFQHGKAWTWIQLDKNDQPLRVAIAIDEEAMQSLDPGADHNGGHNHTNGVLLAFHPKAALTPFKHALLDWNPNGHEPAGIYTLPHFDFHFYMTSEVERQIIPPYEVDSTGFLNFPEPGYMPATLPNLYVPSPGGIPQMGTHWVDVSSPELNGGIFGQTFVYGSFNGKVTFYEPMITKLFLDENPSFQRSFPVPNRFNQAGWYPTQMRIEKDSGITHIILEGFVFRQAS
jgi:hypothetical protein